VKLAVSIALLAVFLAMPLNCILAACQVPNPAHQCCPRTSASFKCPYDALDFAKTATCLAVAGVPVAPVTEIAPPLPTSASEPSPSIVQDRGDLCILNRILRI
jgi:hypothetical protein